MDYNGVRKERAIEHLETATCSPTTADEKYICNRGGSIPNRPRLGYIYTICHARNLVI